MNYSFEYIGGNDVMPIITYYGPVPQSQLQRNNETDIEFPDYFSKDFFQMIAELGINVLGKCDTDYAKHPDLVKKLLQMGEEYGIGVIVNDSRLNGKSRQEVTLEQVAAYVEEYKEYPAYIGNYVTDEPNHKEYWCPKGGEARLIETYAPICQKLNALGIFGYSNLHPNWMNADEELYKKYLKEFVEMCNVPYLSYDMYPFDYNGMKYVPRYFRNLTQAREIAEQAEIPFWTFIQAGAQWNDAMKRFDSEEYFPSQGKFFWNVGTCLAFGSKGMQYFPLIQPSWFAWAETQPYDFERNGLIGADGRKNRWYYYAQKMNAQIAAVDEVLMNAVNHGVIVASDLAKEHVKEVPQYIIKDDAWRELAGIRGEAMIGCFDYKGKTAFYVVNYDMENDQTIELELNCNCAVTIIKDAVKYTMNTNCIALDFTAGNSALVVLE